MNYSDWITLSAVIVALILGIWANIQTKSIKTEDNKNAEWERKERKLKEIINWSIVAANGSFDDELYRMKLVTCQSEQLIEKVPETSGKLTYNSYGQSKYILKLAESIDDDLKISVEKLCNKLDELWTKEVQDSNMVWANISHPDLRFEIYKLSNDVIEKAVKLL